MGKVYKKGALTNYVLITGFKSEFDKIDKLCVIYIESDSVMDFISELEKVVRELEKISASIVDDHITILTSITPDVFKIVECKLFVHHLDRRLYLDEKSKDKITDIKLF